MIKRIFVSNSPTFKHLELYVKDGLNTISGISGSGKSVFLHSILGAFGLKEPNAEVIEISLNVNFNNVGINLEDFGILNEYVDGESEIVISVLKKQNIRYFINNQSISKKKLSEIAKYFVKHISIKDAYELESNYMLDTLDSIIMQKDSKFGTLLSQYNKVFHEFKSCKIEIHDILDKQKNIENLKDFAQFEIDKISRINPKPGEYDKLLHDKKMLSKKEKVMQICKKALHSLDGLDHVSKAIELLDIDGGEFISIAMDLRGNIENAIDEFENLDIEPEALLERIAELSEINRKYGSEEEAIKHLESQKEKIKEYDNIEFDKTQLEKRFKELEYRIIELSESISKKRVKFIVHFEKKLNYYAKQLRLENINIKHSQGEYSHKGIDMLNILLSAKQKNVVSSGEYNRMRLAMLCVSAEYSSNCNGILILDEIDANLSGEESEGVAKLLQFLSNSYQIFAISHQPFMPLMCDQHYLISKDSNNEANIKLLDKQEQVKEIARIVGGSNLSKDTLIYAEKLLQQEKRKNS